MVFLGKQWWFSFRKLHIWAQKDTLCEHFLLKVHVMNSDVKYSRYFMISWKDWIFQSEHRSVTVQIVTTCKIKNLQLKIQSLVLRRKPNLNSYSILSTENGSFHNPILIENVYFHQTQFKIRCYGYSTYIWLLTLILQ